MTVAVLLRSLVAALDAAGVPFMLTGSLAAAFHGAGRATMDIDVVIDPTAEQLQALVAAIAESGAYVSREAAEEALTHRTMFNAVDIAAQSTIKAASRRSRVDSRFALMTQWATCLR